MKCIFGRADPSGSLIDMVGPGCEGLMLQSQIQDHGTYRVEPVRDVALVFALFPRFHSALSKGLVQRGCLGCYAQQGVCHFCGIARHESGVGDAAKPVRFLTRNE